MKCSTRQIFLALILALLSPQLLPLEAVYAQRHDNGRFDRAGASPRVNSRFNLQNRGNLNSRSNFNRGNFNSGNVNYRNNINIRQGNYSGGSYGGHWNGNRYDTPLGWGLTTFAAGLVIGTVINNLPPYYVPIDVGGINYIYSDGVFLEPRGNNYIITRPPIGAVVPSIPDGCTTISSGGVVYYNCSGIIYQPFYLSNNLVYRVVQY